MDFENGLFESVHVKKLYTHPNLTRCDHDIVAHLFMGVLTAAFSKHNRAEKVNLI